VRLTELEPKFLRRLDDTHFQRVDTIAEADGIQFLCPACWIKNNGPVGTHAVICWRPEVPQSTFPNPGRWTMQGTSFEDLSLVAGSSSVLIRKTEEEVKKDGSGDPLHILVTNGEIRFV